MSSILVIPDVHLKPWIFREADKLSGKHHYDAFVMLGDLVDDWGQETNLALYNETFDEAVSFAASHRDTFWCYGNHDVSYLWEAMESGYSYFARETVVNRIAELKNALPPEYCGFIFRIDNVLFSHAGLTENFVLKHFGMGGADLDQMLMRINGMGREELWQDESPIWARPQFGETRLFSCGLLQVVGHTPVKKPRLAGNLLTLDTFSTYRYGDPIGDERLVRVDTITKRWEYADS